MPVPPSLLCLSGLRLSALRPRPVPSRNQGTAPVQQDSIGLVITVAALVSLLASCVARPPWPPDADAALAAIEARMLDAPIARVDYRITADGAFAAEFDGTLGLGVRDRTLLVGNGSFGGAPQRLLLTAEDGTMRGLLADSVAFEATTPPALREALLLGLTRMGLLHNLARLTAGRPPDHAEAGVEGWIEAFDAAWGPTEEIAGRKAKALTFSLRVAGTDAADVTLWLDAATGWPAGRDQTVAFPGGTMTVTERYGVWSLHEAHLTN